MELNQMEYFLTVARTQHVTKAAEVLNITQPALSHSLAKLEEELGVQLFERSGRNVQLNRYGKLFAGRVEEALRQVGLGKQEISELANPESGVVSLAFLNILGSEVVPKLISAFHRRYPAIRFELEQGNYQTVRGLLDSGQSDLAIVSPCSNIMGVNRALLFETDLFAVVPEGHRLGERNSVWMKELEDEPFIDHNPNCGFRAVLERSYRQTGFTPKVKYQAEDLQTVAGFVSAGLGVALLPPSKGLRLPNMSWIPVKDPVCRCEVGLEWKDKRYLSPAVRLFREFVIEFYEKKEVEALPV
ncbi:LysR family transcriptional regulator [Cohnella cholangitidis]|uniref:LysR family transcriptional regulator n=1 Tax=Cohnella cholangitidis TaxID=2598458 RepID=A0A7G5C3K5_9BACL|nr:LysR family transcriptional regulator [Cohnella cholangitidis]QMV43789.1 LysR family transcriptional regulator [Cohnella cholangitidis]